MAAAAAFAERGLDVVSAGPPGPLRWPAEYGAWADEMERLGLDDATEHRWAETEVAFGPGERRLLGRGYVRVDRAALAHRLEQRFTGGGGRRRDAEVREVSHAAGRSTVRCRDGTEIAARVVVDASGHRPVLVRRRVRPGQGFQTAWGLTVELRDDSARLEPGRALLMDWSDPLPEPPAGAAPSFLYAMPLGDGRCFVEETVLVARPVVPPERLERRLAARLAARGLRVHRVLARERCWIPMGGALPDLRQRVVGFGAAGGMVHPATGYLLPRVLEAAPPLADAIRDALGRNGAAPADAARAGWSALWSADRQRRRALFVFGMEVLLRLDVRATRQFFGAFFELPPEEWQGFLSDTLPAPELARAMSRFFVGAPRELQRTLLRTAAGSAGARLAAGLLSSVG
jgi:lycopene beta-cyclase